MAATVPQPQRVLERVIEQFAGRLGLSGRQQLVLRYLALGYRYQEIGELLGIRTRTVKFHVDNMRKKLGACSRVELLAVLFLPRRGE
jgi:DNA-binding CsgD family transcriptional regulator